MTEEVRVYGKRTLATALAVGALTGLTACSATRSPYPVTMPAGLDALPSPRLAIAVMPVGDSHEWGIADSAPFPPDQFTTLQRDDDETEAASRCLGEAMRMAMSERGYSATVIGADGRATVSDLLELARAGSYDSLLVVSYRVVDSMKYGTHDFTVLPAATLFDVASGAPLWIRHINDLGADPLGLGDSARNAVREGNKGSLTVQQEACLAGVALLIAQNLGPAIPAAAPPGAPRSTEIDTVELREAQESAAESWHADAYRAVAFDGLFTLRTMFGGAVRIDTGNPNLSVHRDVDMGKVFPRPLLGGGLSLVIRNSHFITLQSFAVVGTESSYGWHYATEDYDEVMRVTKVVAYQSDQVMAFAALPSAHNVLYLGVSIACLLGKLVGSNLDYGTMVAAIGGGPAAGYALLLDDFSLAVNLTTSFEWRDFNGAGGGATSLLFTVLIGPAWDKIKYRVR